LKKASGKWFAITARLKRKDTDSTGMVQSGFVANNAKRPSAKRWIGR